MGCSSVFSSIWSCTDENGNNLCYKTDGPEKGECFESFASRAPVQEDTTNGYPQVGDGLSDPNKIANVTIQINCQHEAEDQMKLSPGSTEEPEPLQVIWVWDNAPPGLSLDPHSGVISGNTKGPGKWPVTIYARDEDGNEIDQKSYQVTAQDCSEGIQFQWPGASGSYVNSRFGWRIHPIHKTRKFHYGVDIKHDQPTGVTIHAAADGEVISAGSQGGYGNTIVLAHKLNNETKCRSLYAHCASFNVNVGQQVTKGQQIAIEGKTGGATGNHLHFEIREGASGGASATAIDPLLYLNGQTKYDDGGTYTGPETDGQPRPASSNVTTINATNRIYPAEGRQKCESGIPIGDTGVPSNVNTGASGPVSGEDPCGDTGSPPTNGNGCSGMTKEQVIADIKRELDADPNLTSGDKDFILFTAKIESNYNPCAKNPKTSATGLFQMVDSTANSVYNYAGLGTPTCADRIDTTKSTQAMIKFYKKEIKPAWESYLSSGKTKIRGYKIKNTAHSARYPSLSQIQFCYGLIHHDGIGNAVAGKDAGGIAYISKKLNEV